MSQLTFGEALDHLQNGGKVTREAWKGTIEYIFIDPHVDIFRSVCPGDDSIHNIELFGSDILADDWVIVLKDDDNGYEELTSAAS